MNEEFKWATELKEQHPDVLKYYSPVEIKNIWVDYSQGLAAHWINHEGLSDEAVQRVFDHYMIINHWELWKKVT